MATLSRFGMMALVALVACENASEPDPGPDPTWVVSRPLPAAGTYEAVVIDSVGFTLLGVGLTETGEVIGSMGGNDWEGAFRWKSGVVTALRVPGENLLIRAVNDQGDLIGGYKQYETYPPNADKRAIIWRSGTAAPTRLFPNDTPVIALDIADDGQVLLYPKNEFFPGASVWRDGEIRRLTSGVAVQPKQLVSGGLMRVGSRGTLVDSTWIIASPFNPSSKSELGKACPGTSPVAVQLLDRSGTRGVVQKIVDGVRTTYVATSTYCQKWLAKFGVMGLSKNGWLATLDSVAFNGISYGAALGISDGSAVVPIRSLANAGVDPVTGGTYDFEAIVAVNSNGWILTLARYQTVQRGKQMSVLLKPK